METTIKQKSTLFRVNKNNGQAFIATAELLGIDKNDLLNELMGSYVKSIQEHIAERAAQYPEFSAKYPFTDND